jgi:hypothetical protein
MEGEYFKRHLRALSELEHFIESEGIRIREQMATKLAQLQTAAAMKRQATKEAKDAALRDSRTRAAEARVAARLLKATDLAVEKARLQSEKAAEKACRQEQKLASQKQESQERAALKLAKQAQAAAEKLKMAELKTPRTNSIKQDRVARKASKQAVLARNMAVRKDTCSVQKEFVFELTQENYQHESQQPSKQVEIDDLLPLVPLGSSSTLLLEHHDGPVERMKRKRVVGSVSGIACGTLGVNQVANHQNVAKIMRERNKDLVIEEMRQLHNMVLHINTAL